MRKHIIIAMAVTLLFSFTGCKSIGTTDGKSKEPVITDNVDVIKEETTTEDKKVDSKEETTDNKNENLDVVISTEKDVYGKGVEEITLILENNSSNEYYYGAAFTLEKKVEDEWILVSPKEEVFFIEIAYSLIPNGTGSSVSKLTPYGELSDGEYRIVKEMIKQTSSDGDNTSTPEKYNVTAEFTISSGL